MSVSAMTACFSGPIQNTLLTLGVAFLIKMYQEESYTLDFSATSHIYVSLGLLLGSLVVTFFVVVLSRFTVPKLYSYILISFYVVYCGSVFAVASMK